MILMGNIPKLGIKVIELISMLLKLSEGSKLMNPQIVHQEARKL